MDNSVISTISEAARKKQKVRIRYRDKTNNVTERETEPYEFKNGRYFGCTESGIRGFNIDSIISAEFMNETFMPKWPIKI